MGREIPGGTHNVNADGEKDKSSGHSSANAPQYVDTSDVSVPLQPMGDILLGAQLAAVPMAQSGRIVGATRWCKQTEKDREQTLLVKRLMEATFKLPTMPTDL